MKRFGFWPIVASGTKARGTAILLALVVAVLSIPVMVYAFGTNPPLGNTGAPGQGTCASCHGTLTAGSGVTVTAPTTYTPGGAAVSMAVSIPTTGGFELAVLTQSGNAQAGTLAAGSTQDTVSTSGAIQYVYSAAETTSWTFLWTPPATNVGNVVVYATGGTNGTSGSHSYVLTPAAAATPDFSLSASPTSLTIAQGASATDTITVTPKNGFNGTVAFSASGPPGVTASFSTAGVMTLSASSTAAAGTSTVTVTGTSGTLSHTTTLALTVTAPVAQPGFTLSALPKTVAISQGTSGTSTITVVPTGGFNGTVAFTTSPLPSGVTATFSTAGVMTLTASSTATPGTSTVTITGTSTSPPLSNTTTVTLMVSATLVPDFNLSASPPTLSIPQGSSGTSTITITPANGFTGTVALAASAPPGVTASISTARVLTLSASSTAAAGSSTVTITGTSGTLTHTTTVALTVTAPASASISATPSALSFAYQIGGAAPGTQNVNVSTTGTVTYSVATTGGAWLSATPTSGSSSAPVTVSVHPTGLTAGTYNGTVTITASGATGSPQSVKITLAVAQAGTSSLTVNPSSLTFTSLSSGGDDASEASGTQRLAVTSMTGSAVSYTTKETTQSGGSWLILASSGGTTPGTLVVSVNTRGMASGTYHGTITITPDGTAAGPQMVPVTLTVGSPTTSSLRVTPRRLSFSFSGTTDSGSKTVHVTSGSGAREFSVASSGGSWLNVSPTSATTPATLTVSVDGRGLSTGTYSGMITLTAGTRKTLVYVTMFVATSGSGGGGDDGSETESQLAVQPIVNDPTNSGTVGAALLDAAGVPVSSGTASNSGNLALALSKTVQAPAGTSAGAQLVGAENLVKLTELGFDVRQGGHCTANSPHFVVVTSDDVTHVVTGCANGTIQTAPAQGWIRVRFDPANPAQASPPIAPGQSIKSIAIALDQGPEATPNPGGGLVVLDNIDVNGVIVGKD